MSVYVDDMEAPYGRMLMCHMMADTHTELVRMADAIGVPRRWIQHAGRAMHEHFDIAKVKRALAVKLGAIEVTYPAGLAELLEARKGDAFAERYFIPIGHHRPAQTELL